MFDQEKILDTEKSLHHETQHSKFELHEEYLDISKRFIDTGEVTIRKEVITEEKNITISVVREELVIEKRVLDTQFSDKTNSNTSIIRIPLKEENIEIIKHPVLLQNVKIYRNQWQSYQHIDETLRKEMLKVETSGDANVIYKEDGVQKV
jgi:uncharacterized protein (TIGR02271 family)